MALACRIADHKTVSGVTLMRLGWTGDWERFCERMRDAIALIKTWDRRRYQAIQRRVRYFILVDAGGDSFYEDVYAVMINDRTVATCELPKLALLIVHEATHAMICRRGVSGRTAPLRAPE